MTAKDETSGQTPAGQMAPRGALASLSMAMLLSSLGTSIANVGLPNFAHEFGASFQEVQWIVLSYLLAIATLIVSVGRLGDLIGRRRLLLAGIALFTLASVLCGLAPSLPVLVLVRALQGLGAAVMMALALAFVGETVPREKTGSAIGLLGTMSATGTALGPAIGGFLIAAFGWRSIFLINLPLGLLALLAAYRTLPRDRQAQKADGARFDSLGTVLLAFTLGAYSLSMTIGGGRFGPVNLALLGAAAAGLMVFVRSQMRRTSPLVQLALFRIPVLSAGFAMSVLVMVVMMATLVVGPFYLSRTLRLDPGGVGLVMAAGPVIGAFAGIPAGRFADRLGSARMSVIGLSGIAAGCLLLAAIPASLGPAGYLLAILVLSPTYALFQAANNTAVMTAAGPEHRGVVSGMLNLSRNLGLITGASAMGAVFALAAGTSEMATANAAAVDAGMRVTFVVGAGIILAALAVAVMSQRRAAA